MERRLVALVGTKGEICMNRFFMSGVAVLIIALTLIGCSKTGDDAKEKIYDVKGKVVAVDVENKEVTLDHEEIAGHMTAMKMRFPVENAKLLEGIKAGDQVHGKLKNKDGKDTVIELMKH
jgi:Cu/Ag efflux protein CusF